MNSIIITYRDRQSHLAVLLPRLREVFKGTDYEIIVVEQDNQEFFWKSALYNFGMGVSKGDTLILHDVDHYPHENVDYTLGGFDASYPVRQVIYVDEDGKEKSEDQIPAGYRGHKISTGNHSGGVVVISKTAYMTVKGFNPFYVSWGKEDDDFRERLSYYNLTIKRPETGLFLALPHKDNCPSPTEPTWQAFQANQWIYSNRRKFLDVEFEMDYEAEKFTTDRENETWYKIKKFDLKMTDEQTKKLKEIQ